MEGKMTGLTRGKRIKSEIISAGVEIEMVGGRFEKEV